MSSIFTLLVHFFSPEPISTNFVQVVFELRAFLFLKNYASVKGCFDKERMKVDWVVRMLDTSAKQVTTL